MKKYPTKFVGCCLANPADDGIGIKHLEELVTHVRKEKKILNPFIKHNFARAMNSLNEILFIFVSMMTGWFSCSSFQSISMAGRPKGIMTGMSFVEASCTVIGFV